MTSSEIQELADVYADIPPEGMRAEKRRIILKNMNLVYRDQVWPWKWHLTDAGSAAFACEIK